MSLETITLVIDENPTHTLCPGHVNGKTFTKAYESEWGGTDPYVDKDLTHEYWVRRGDVYERSNKSDVMAAPYTVSTW